EKLEQEGSGDGEAVQFPAALRAMLDRLEDELRRDAVSEESRVWLTQCGLTAEQMKNQLEPRPEPERKLHLYHCDHRGLPLALISPDNTVAWRAEYDEWGNLLGEENPEHLEQLIRLPGQQYDEESGLHYNRHRYYNPGQGRYITQDPAGLAGGWNLYQYPLDPLSGIDPLGLVDINLYPAKDPIHSVANEINISGIFTVGGHGTHTSIESATGNRMMPKDLAVLIKFDANYKEGMPVWLFSCNTGKGQNSFASQLAKELHTNVTGPDTLWSWWGRGSGNVLKMDTVLTAPTNLNTYKSLMSVTTKDLGNWVTYGPSGNVISIIPGKPERPGDIK
ncbi:RHS repeat protein, partial [Salmonella enterica subsp. salamae]|nr:RHS repeat protein [Salmonella enterica subsp. salamae]